MPKAPVKTVSWESLCYFFWQGLVSTNSGYPPFLTYFAISPDSIKKILKNPQIFTIFLIFLNKLNFPPKSQGVYFKNPSQLNEGSLFCFKTQILHAIR